MSDFDDMLTNTAQGFADTFGEAVTFTPSGGTGRTINAIVTRRLPDGIDGASAGTTPMIEVEIERHATRGALAINRGGDKITVAATYGGTAVARNIASILSEDAGMIRLLLR